MWRVPIFCAPTTAKKLLTDDVFVGLTAMSRASASHPLRLRCAMKATRRGGRPTPKAIENLLGIKRGILSDAEAVSKTATEINSSAGDYSLSIMDFQHLYL